MPKDKKLLFEDLTAFQDKWATGTSGRNVGPQRMTLMDLLARAQGDVQHPNNVTAAGPDIYGSQVLIELLGNLYVDAERVADAIKITNNSPILKGRHDSHAQLNKILKKIRVVQKLVKSIGADVDNFTVDKAKE